MSNDNATLLRLIASVLWQYATLQGIVQPAEHPMIALELGILCQQIVQLESWLVLGARLPARSLGRCMDHRILIQATRTRNRYE